MVQESALLLYEVGLLIVASSLASELFKRLRLPGLIGAIVVGVIGGPGVLKLVTDFTVISILAVAVAVRLAGGLMGGVLSGFRGRILLTVSLGLAIRAEMSVIIAREGVAAGIVGGEFLTLATIMAVGSMIVILPPFSKLITSV